MSHSLVILSDLHIGANDGFDIFQSAGKVTLLRDFLEYVGKREAPVELILNGDVVDFLQLRPWDELTRTTAERKMQTIAQCNPEIFRAFGDFLRDGRHRIRILLGNHDVELAYPEVWKILRDAIDAGERLQLFNSRSTYNPEVNGILVHVEHGNAGDPWNAINYPQLFTDAELGTGSFVYPPGSKLVFETINPFKEELKFVDVLKPQIPAVPLLLLALRPRLAATSFPSALPRALGALANTFLIRLRLKLAGPAFKAGSAVPPEPLQAEVEEAMAAAYLETVGDLERFDMLELEHFLDSRDRGAAAEPVFGQRLDKVRLWLMAAALKNLERFRGRDEGGNFFQRDHPGNWAVAEAQKRLEGKVRLVVFGHTHEALKTEFPDGTYVNSGAWANLVSLPPGRDPALLEWLGKLADDTFERTSFPTYVTVDPTAGGALVRLNLWTSEGERELWRKNISR